MPPPPPEQTLKPTCAWQGIPMRTYEVERPARMALFLRATALFVSHERLHGRHADSSRPWGANWAPGKLQAVVIIAQKEEGRPAMIWRWSGHSLRTAAGDCIHVVRTQIWGVSNRIMNPPVPTFLGPEKDQELERPREPALGVVLVFIYGEIALSDEYLKVVAGMHSQRTLLETF